MSVCRIILSIVVVVCCFTDRSWGWGKEGHQAASIVAIRLMPPSPIKELLAKNVNGMRYLSFVPDMPWKHGGTNPHPLEGHTHFFNIDFYGSQSAAIPRDFKQLYLLHGRAKVVKNGTTPFRIQQIANYLVKAMKDPNPSAIEIIQLAGVLSHYVADIGNPLHVVTDYNGNGVGAPGLHSFFETKTVVEMNFNELLGDVRKEAMPLLPKIPNNLKPVDVSIFVALSANKESAALFASAKKWGLSPMLQRTARPVIARTLGLSSAVLAKIWHAAWVAAGAPNLPIKDHGMIDTPDWIPVRYLNGLP
jgi:hypothetical protein